MSTVPGDAFFVKIHILAQNHCKNSVSEALVVIFGIYTKNDAEWYQNHRKGNPVSMFPAVPKSIISAVALTFPTSLYRAFSEPFRGFYRTAAEAAWRSLKVRRRKTDTTTNRRPLSMFCIILALRAFRRTSPMPARLWVSMAFPCMVFAFIGVHRD